MVTKNTFGLSLFIASYITLRSMDNTVLCNYGYVMFDSLGLVFAALYGKLIVLRPLVVLCFPTLMLL